MSRWVRVEGKCREGSRRDRVRVHQVSRAQTKRWEVPRFWWGQPFPKSLLDWQPPDGGFLLPRVGGAVRPVWSVRA